MKWKKVNYKKERDKNGLIVKVQNKDNLVSLRRTRQMEQEKAFRILSLGHFIEIKSKLDLQIERAHYSESVLTAQH